MRIVRWLKGFPRENLKFNDLRILERKNGRNQKKTKESPPQNFIRYNLLENQRSFKEAPETLQMSKIQFRFLITEV